MKTEVVWSACDAAAYLKINIKTLYDFLKRPHVPGVLRVGRKYRILKEPFLQAWASGAIRNEEAQESDSASQNHEGTTLLHQATNQSKSNVQPNHSGKTS